MYRIRLFMQVLLTTQLEKGFIFPVLLIFSFLTFLIAFCCILPKIRLEQLVLSVYSIFFSLLIYLLRYILRHLISF